MRHIPLLLNLKIIVIVLTYWHILTFTFLEYV